MRNSGNREAPIYLMLAAISILVVAGGIYFSDAFGPTGYSTFQGCFSSGSYTDAAAVGEVQYIIQEGGAESPPQCNPSSCSDPSYTDVGIISDKYQSPTDDYFRQQRICIKNGAGTIVNKCTLRVSNYNYDAFQCNPNPCPSGTAEIGKIKEARDRSGAAWTQNVYRICGSGSLGGGSISAASNTESGATCPAGLSQLKMGSFKESHFVSGEQDFSQKYYAICISYDTSPPTQVGNLKATANSQTAITLTWSAAMDNVVVKKYEIFRGSSENCGEQRSTAPLVNVTATSYADSNLNENTVYCYDVRAYDNAGNPGLKAEVNNKTLAYDTTPPTVLSTNIQNNAQNVKVNVGKMHINFSEFVVVVVAPSPIIFSPQVQFTKQDSIDNKNVTLTFSSNLAYGTTYKINVTKDVVDGAGNKMASDHIVTFTTEPAPPGPDIEPPQVFWTDINDGDVDVGVNTSSIKIGFSEAIDKTTDAAIKILPQKDFSKVWTSDRKNVTLNFDGNFNYSTTYSLTIETDLKDLAGNKIQGPYMLEFTTASAPIAANQTNQTTTTTSSTTTTTLNTCSVPYGTGAYAGGACAISSCDSGRYNCDGNNVNGCEATAPCSTTTATSAITEAEALSSIQDANQTIIVSAGTKNITEAMSLYAQSIESFNTGDYSTAKTLALQAKGAIKDYAAPSQEIPLTYILIVAVLAIAVGGFFYLKVVKKPRASPIGPPAAPATTPKNF